MGKWLFALLFAFSLNAQNTALTVTWKDFEDVTFKETYLKNFDDWFLVPAFGQKVKEFENKTVQITGYIIPLDVEGNVYALSAFAFSSCFFCGGAGPESVMTLKFKYKPRSYKTDDVVTLSGKLILNNTIPEDFSYVLENVVEIK